MARETAATSPSVAPRPEVMAAVDGSPERLVLADVTRDEAWLSMGLDRTISVLEWR